MLDWFRATEIRGPKKALRTSAVNSSKIGQASKTWPERDAKFGSAFPEQANPTRVL